MAKFNFTGANVRTMILKAHKEKALEGDEYVEYDHNGNLIQVLKDQVRVFGSDKQTIRVVVRENYAGDMEYFYAVARQVRKLQGDTPMAELQEKRFGVKKTKAEKKPIEVKDAAPAESASVEMPAAVEVPAKEELEIF